MYALAIERFLGVSAFRVRIVLASEWPCIARLLPRLHFYSKVIAQGENGGRKGLATLASKRPYLRQSSDLPFTIAAVVTKG